MKNRDHVWLESGFEHDLLRKVDRDPMVQRILAQPFTRSWSKATQRSKAGEQHTPDMLTVHGDGVVTVWDARALERHDDEFRAKAEITRQACLEVGWRYELFTGYSDVERLDRWCTLRC